MESDAARARMLAQIPPLAKAVTAMDCAGPVQPEDLVLLPTTGLAHDHIRLSDTGLVLRVPRQSQLSLNAHENLAYQTACFERAGPSGRTPRLRGVVAPGADIPMGALLVDFIEGEVVSLPDGLPDVAETLAAIHGLPVPAAPNRPPLRAPTEPLAATMDEVLAQAAYLRDNKSIVEPESRRQIEEEIDWASSFVAGSGDAPVTLISFDAHPGNFIAEPANASPRRAVLVDLEKARYGVPGFDLAHASLYTSTTWDVSTYAELIAGDVSAFYTAWLAGAPPSLANAMRPWLLPCRRIMWLWSVTWCAKWAVESGRGLVSEKHQAGSTEDWSAENTAGDLVDHVAGRVKTYLDPEIVWRVRQDWAAGNALADIVD